MRLGKRIVVIPDTQVRPGVPIQHFDWIGQAIADYRPDYVVHIGDHWDMPSLSQHGGPLDRKGSDTSRTCWRATGHCSGSQDAMGDFQPKRKIILRGNHEQRIERGFGPIEAGRRIGLRAFQ